MLSRLFCIAIAVTFISGCSKQVDHTPAFFAQGKPPNLFDWNILRIDGNQLVPTTGVMPYTLNSTLFSDYAHKFRTINIPDNQIITINDDGTLNFPTGSVISKTFYYPKGKQTNIELTEQKDFEQFIDLAKNHLVETRLLVKRAEGWAVFPYVWNKEQNQATLERFGRSIDFTGEDTKGQSHTFTYNVPDVNQCAGCHVWSKGKGLQPIGPKVRHLNRSVKRGTESINQLRLMANNLLVDLSDKNADHFPANVYSFNNAIDLNQRARSYLDINCAHCHNPDGPANTSGLHLETFRQNGSEMGICKLPIAAGSGTGDRTYDIHPGKPEDSIFSYRLSSTDVDKMMPELGRALAHEEGVDLINQWIRSLQGACAN